MENENKDILQNPSEEVKNEHPYAGKTLSEILASKKRDDAILSVRNLHVSFKTDEGLVHAVRGVTFDLYKGETLCIVGESGSGKSVTSKTIMGILGASALIEQGSVLYEGEDLTKIDESEFHRIRGHKIGMIFQDPLSSLNPIMKVGKQITEAMLVNGNLLKRMKNDIIAKENAEYKNNEVTRNAVFHQVDRKIEASDEEFEKEIYALQTKVNEADLARDQYQKDTEEYKKANEEFLALKQQTKKDIKELETNKKKKHAELVKEGRAEKAEANRKYKEKLPALKAALKAKSKEADIAVKEYKAKEKETYIQESTEIKNRLYPLLKEYYLTKDAGRRNEIRPQLDAEKKALKASKEKYHSKLRISKKEAKEKALAVMKEVGIPQPEQRFKQYPFEFSGGMRQRIVIAIALTANPDVLICDEPTTALDVTIQAQILELINRLKKERNMSIIFITHDLGVVANMADRVAVMYAGKIVEVGTVNEIFYDPKHPYTWALLSSIPDIDSKEKLEAIPGTPPYLLNPPKGDAFAARNKYAMGVDFLQEPPFFEVSETHYAATWLLDERAPKTEKPKIVSQRIKVSLQKAGVKND